MLVELDYPIVWPHIGEFIHFIEHFRTNVSGPTKVMSSASRIASIFQRDFQRWNCSNNFADSLASYTALVVLQKESNAIAPVP